MCRLLLKVSVVTTRATARTDAEESRAHRHRGPTLTGLERHANPNHAGAENPPRAMEATIRVPDVERSRGRRATRCGAEAKARTTATRLRTVMSTSMPKPSTVQSHERPRAG